MRTKKPKHPTTEVLIGGEWVAIDLGILPVILWLNRIPGIETLYCCQGDPDTKERPGSCPYVMFTFRTLKAINTVRAFLKVLLKVEPGSKADGRVSFWEATLCVHSDLPAICLRWRNPEHLNDFIRERLGQVRDGKSWVQEVPQARDAA